VNDCSFTKVEKLAKDSNTDYELHMNSEHTSMCTAKSFTDSKTAFQKLFKLLGSEFVKWMKCMTVTHVLVQ